MARVRVACTAVGDLAADPGLAAKHSDLLAALARRTGLADVLDVSPRGTARLVMAGRTWRPGHRRWHERFHQNVAAFGARSRRASALLGRLSGRADVVLQLGCLFDSRLDPGTAPSVIYTDYTMRLAAERRASGRAPLSARELRRWIELERRAYGSAAHVLTRGAQARDSIVEDYGIHPARVTAIGGGLNFPEVPQPRPRCPADGAPTVLFVGKDLRRKGGDLVLEAFARAREKVPAARLLLLTAGERPRGVDLTGVEFVRPTWDRAAVATLYRGAAVFAMPSRCETWGDSLIEAMAFGLPCVGVADEAMPEIVEDGRTGLLVPPGDAAALAAALERLLADATLRRQLGDAGRDRVTQRFTWDAVVGRMLPFLEAAR
jgi:glycosyltransferase involved in cell wall biosynthesis